MVEPTHFKNMLVKLEIFPNDRGEKMFQITTLEKDHKLPFPKLGKMRRSGTKKLRRIAMDQTDNPKPK